MFRRSFPASKGAARIAHSAMCVRYSSRFMPPLPTSSMSGSFQCPGPANFSRPFCPNPIKVMRSYVSLMSPVVRHKLPVVGPQRQGVAELRVLDFRIEAFRIAPVNLYVIDSPGGVGLGILIFVVQTARPLF